MLEAVLFDLDGTLLDIDIDAFLGTYFKALSGALSEVFTDSDELDRAMRAIHDATGAMMRPHEPITNCEVFYAAFRELSGVSLEAHAEVIDRFYAEVFPTLQGGIRPAEGGLEALRAARDCGLRVAVATNPIFPRAAIIHRMAWAGIAPDDVDVITDFETMCATKPLPAYFRQTAALLGVETSNCLMVGDDRMLDLSAADIGMRTFHVCDEPGSVADYTGSMSDVAAVIRRLGGCETELPTG